ncbi:MAG: iron ABC transporter permease [Paenibacillaceae bacterium]
MGAKPNSLRKERNVNFQYILIGVCIVIALYLAVLPLIFLLYGSFTTKETISSPNVLTFLNYIEAYSNWQTYALIWNSVKFALGTMSVAFVIGTFLAWVTERTNTPFKSVFFSLSILPLVTPGILFAVSWIMLASPGSGIFNTLLQNLFNTDYVFFNVYSLGGMIFVEGLLYSPMAFLFMTAAFRAMDPSLEESAMMSGAKLWKIVYHVTLKGIWPAVFTVLLLLFVSSMESFEIPALLGLPAGYNVLTSGIYRAINSYPPNVGLGSTYSVSLLVILSVGIYFQTKLANKGSKYSTMTGKAFRPSQIDLGKWRYATAGISLVYFFVVMFLPFLVLLWTSLQPYYRAPSLSALETLTLKNYDYVFSYPAIGRAFFNSFSLAILAATIVMIITAVTSWIIIKTRIRWRYMLDNLVSLPLVFPGIVFGLALMITYLNFNIGVYGTVWILLILYLTKFLPMGLRYNTTSMIQIHKELEESALMSGAQWLSMFRRITIPLLIPGFVTGWIYVAIMTTRELSGSVMLYSPGSEVVSVVIWEMWDNGQFTQLSALGVIFMLSLLLIVIVLQIISRKLGIKQGK